ncbi:MAG: Haloacid dehalogenase-like hydrolase, partial [uncultured Acetobacteraceae bacterium]
DRSRRDQARRFRLHVRPVRHGRGHAGRAPGGRRRVPGGQGLAGRPQRVRHLVAADALRELDDRRPAAPGAHAVPGDRGAFRRPGHGPRRHRPHGGGGAPPRRVHRAAEAVSGGPGGAGPAPRPLPARRALQRRSRHAGSGEAPPRRRLRGGHLRGRSRLLQAAPLHLHQGRRLARRPHGRSAVRRQPRIRRGRGQGGRHARRLHRPAPPPLRPVAAPAGPDRAEHDGAGRRHRL